MLNGFIKKSISLSPKLYRFAKDKADNRHSGNLSGYIAYLISCDMEERKTGGAMSDTMALEGRSREELLQEMKERGLAESIIDWVLEEYDKRINDKSLK